MSTLGVDHPQFDYPPAAYPHAGRCRLRIYDQGGGETVLVLTDLGDENPGASVTNAVETIVTTAVRRYALDPARLTVVEHYHDRWMPELGAGRHARTVAELRDIVGREAGGSFDVVTFSHVPDARTAAGEESTGRPRPERRRTPTPTRSRGVPSRGRSGAAFPSSRPRP
jgi:hypothetical protein